MTDNVIDMQSRRPFWVVQKEGKDARRRAKRRMKKEADEARLEHKAALLSCLRDITKLVEDDKLEGLVVLSRNPQTKLFLTDIVLDDRIIPPNDWHSFVGALTGLNNELASAAAEGPILSLEGDIIYPVVEADLYEEGDYE